MKDLKRLNELEIAERAIKMAKLLDGVCILDVQEVLRTTEVYVFTSTHFNVKSEDFKMLLENADEWRTSSDSLN